LERKSHGSGNGTYAFRSTNRSLTAATSWGQCSRGFKDE